MDNTMRDKIAEIIVADVEWHTDNAVPWQGMQAADAIIAALPDMIAPLVWVEKRNDYWHAKGTNYQVAPNGGGKWRVRLGNRIIFKSRLSRCDAQATANTHYRDAGMAAFGVTE